MARYFFNIAGPESIADTEGSELDGLEAARSHAVADARDLWRREFCGLDPTAEWRIEVTDSDGRLLLTVPLNAARA